MRTQGAEYSVGQELLEIGDRYFESYCDEEGFTRIQLLNSYASAGSFDLPMEDYIYGIYEPFQFDAKFIGLEALNLITTRKAYSLKVVVEIGEYPNETIFESQWSNFRVEVSKKQAKNLFLFQIRPTKLTLR